LRGGLDKRVLDYFREIILHVADSKATAKAKALTQRAQSLKAKFRKESKGKC
jgi:hypothetical protein